MATGRIGVTPTLGVRWSKAPAAGTTSLSGLDDNSVSLVYSVGYEQVYRNGVLLSRGNDYTATNGTTVTLTDATVTGDIIEIFANELVPLADAISKGQFTAKGSLLSATAASTPGVLAVGSNNQVLTADSSTATGLKWATPSSGGMTQLATGTLSGTETSITGISGDYIDLYLVVNNPYVNSANPFAFRVNNNAGNYYQTYMRTGTSANDSQGLTTYASATGGAVNLPTSSSNVHFWLYIRNYTNTMSKVWNFFYASGTAQYGYFGAGYNQSFTSAVTSIQLRTDAGTSTFSGGTYTLYGVK